MTDKTTKQQIRTLCHVSAVQLTRSSHMMDAKPPTRPVSAVCRLLVTGVGLAAILILSARSARAGAPTDSKNGADVANALADLAIESNPTIDATEDRIQSLNEQVRQAGAWMDPTFSAEYSNMPIDSPVPGEHPMSGVQLTLRQTFYWPGKVRAREDEARSRLRQERLTLAEKKLQLRANLKRAYYRLALNRQLRAVTEEHVRLVSDFLEVVRIKQEAGIVAQHELLQLRVLVAQLKDDLKSFDEFERSLTGVINATLHRSLDVPVPTPARTPVQDPAFDAPALARRAELERPLLRRFTAEAETHHAAARRSAREGYPDITLWAGYRLRTSVGTDPGTDFVSLGISLPIPLAYGTRWGTEQRRNEKLAEAATQERAAELDSIRGELGRIVASWNRSAQKARTYREELTPAARLALEATFASFQVDRADFASLFQAQVQLLNFERITRMAEASAAEARVDAEALVGGKVR